MFKLFSHLTNTLLVLSACLWYLKGDDRVFFIFWPFPFLCHYRRGSLLIVRIVHKPGPSFNEILVALER